MNFDVLEKNLIIEGLDCLKTKLEKCRLFFDIGSDQRELFENKISTLCDIRNKIESDVGLTTAESNLLLEGLNMIKENLINTRAVFEVGTPQRESLENNLSRIYRIKDSFEKSNSLDGRINDAQQNRQPQHNEKSTFRNNVKFEL